MDEQNLPPCGYGATSESTLRDLRATVDCIECIQSTLTNKMSQNIPNNFEFSTAILKQLSRLRTLLNGDGPALEITRTIVKTNFIELVLNNVTSMLRYENVTEECLRVLAPLTRICSSDATDDASTICFQREVMLLMFKSGGVVFSLLALRGYMNTSLGIRLQGLEVLSALLEFAALSPAAPLLDTADTAELNSHSQRYATSPQKLTSSSSARFDYQNSAGFDRYSPSATKSLYGAPEARQSLLHLTALPANSLSQDSVHQLLLHGAGVVFVRMLQFSVAAASEVSIRRSIWCLRFLVLDTPASLACKVASYNQFACVTALATQLCASSETIRLEAATLLTAMLSSHVDVAGALTQIGAWDDLSSVLARSAEHVSVPSHWLSGSLENIRRLSQIEVGPLPVKRHQNIPGIRNNGADEISAIETALVSHQTEKGLELITEGSTIEDVVATLLQKNRQSARERAGRWSRPASRNMSRPTSRGTLDRSQSNNLFVNTATENGGPHTAQSTPNLQAAVNSHSKAKFDIRTSRFAQNLMESPLGEPVDPAMRRKIMKENNGSLPLHIPFALGGPKMGSRPGPDYGKKKKKQAKESFGKSQTPIVNSNLHEAIQEIGRPGSGKKPDPRFSGLAISDDLLPSRGHVSENAEAAKRTTIKVARQAKFLATKLFEDKAASTVSDDESTAISKLNFAERLQCMIMQVQDLS